MNKGKITGLMLSLILSSSSFASKPLTLVLDWFTNPDHAPIYVAQQQGFFQQAGLKVKLIEPSDPADPPRWVAAGKADLAITYQPQFLLQVDKGLPLVRIGTLIATPLNCMMVLKDGPIKTLKDLKGKKIGFSSAGSAGISLDAYLQSAGLTRKDVKLINVKYELSQALLSRKIDAATGMNRNFEFIQMQFANLPGRAFYPEEYGMPTYNELIIVANKHKLRDPRLPKFLNALAQGVQYLVNHPQASWQKFAKAHPALNNPLNQQAWIETLPRFALRPAALDRARWKNLANYLHAHGYIKTIKPISSYARELNY